MATEKELTYSYMTLSQHGSSARWYFFPYISCGRVIAVQKLKALEHAVIVQHSNSLNRLSHPRALATTVADGQRAAHLHDWDTGVRKAGMRGNVISVHNYYQGMGSWG